MNNRTRTIFTLFATAVIACTLASAISVRVGPVRGVPGSLLRRTPARFDGEAETSRLARRKRNWIADVEIKTV